MIHAPARGRMGDLLPVPADGPVDRAAVGEGGGLVRPIKGNYGEQSGARSRQSELKNPLPFYHDADRLIHYSC